MPDNSAANLCRPVPPGGKIGIVATGSPVEPRRLAAGIARLQSLGFNVEIPLDPTKYYGCYDHGFANGSASDRAAALMQLINDPSVDAIIAARGGYGTLDILGRLDYAQIKSQAKAIVGYSDVTALLAAVHRQTGLAVIHGPTVSKEFAEAGEFDQARIDTEWLISLLSGSSSGLGSLACQPLNQAAAGGAVSGRAIPGNLTMLQTLLGTPWDLAYDGAVLLLEEVGEQPYRVHRALTQMALAGKFERLAAVVFGRFSKCESKQGPTVEEVLNRAALEIVPPQTAVFGGLQFGHNGANRAIPFGSRLTIENGSLRIGQSPVTDL